LYRVLIKIEVRFGGLTPKAEGILVQAHHRQPAGGAVYHDYIETQWKVANVPFVEEVMSRSNQNFVLSVQ